MKEVKIGVLLILIVQQFNRVQAQFYEAAYDCYVSSALDGKKSGDSIGLDLTLNTKFIYTIKANSKYLHLKGTLESLSGIPGSSIDSKSSYTEMYVDLLNHVAYFPQEKEYQKVKLYNLSETCVSGNVLQMRYLRDRDSSVQITMTAGLPWFITPAVFFDNQTKCTGVYTVKAPGMTINLKSEPVFNRGKLDLKEYFLEYKSNANIKEFSFFD